MINNRNINFTIKLLISALIVSFLYINKKIDTQILFIFLSNKLEILIIFIYFLFLLYIPIIIRWKLLLKELNVHVEFMKLLKIGLTSQFLGLLVTGSLGADAVKTIYLLKMHSFEKDLKYKIIFCTMLDKVIGLISLLLLLGITFLIKSELNLLIILLMIMVVSGAVISCCYKTLKNIVMKKIIYMFGIGKKNIIIRIINDTRNLLEKRTALIIALFISFTVQINLALVIMYFTFKVSTINIDYWGFFIISPLAELSTVIPVTPLGIGVGHIAYEEIFTMFGQEGGANVFNLVLLFKIILSLFGFFSYIHKNKI